MAPHSSTLAWKIPWTEEPGGLQSMGSQESDTTGRLHFHFPLSCIGGGNGNPLHCSCLENPRDGGAWQAAIYGVAQSDTTEATQQQQQQKTSLKREISTENRRKQGRSCKGEEDSGSEGHLECASSCREARAGRQNICGKAQTWQRIWSESGRRRSHGNLKATMTSDLHCSEVGSHWRY